MAVMERKPETEKRLDDLNLRVESIDRRMETGFAEVREEFRAVRGEMQSEFQAVRAEMGGMQRTLIQAMFAGFAVMLVGFAGTIATILVTTN
jgi:hypothetical protein